MKSFCSPQKKNGTNHWGAGLKSQPNLGLASDQAPESINFKLRLRSQYLTLA